MSELALEVWEELEKAVSLVTSARRVVMTGARVDLTALEGRIRHLCSSVQTLQRDDTQTMLPVMEALIDDLDHLAQSVMSFQGQVSDRLSVLSGG